MYGVMWRFISLILGLVGFTVTGASSVLAGVDPLESIIRAICVFLALWFLFSLMGFIFVRVVPVKQGSAASSNGLQQEQPMYEAPVVVSDNDLPDLSSFGSSSGSL